MTTLRCADCGELFREEDHPQCWREPFDNPSTRTQGEGSGAGINEHGSPVEQPVCRDCLREEWLHRNSIAMVAR